jgi:signal transduction histidine kinase
VPNFGNRENIYFSYKLYPYNDKWETHDILQNNTLQFGGLKPGSYTLHLRLRNGFETFQFKTTTISFRILEPWYQTWGFYLLCLLGFIALTMGLVKWRTARINERKKELQRQVVAQTKNIANQSRQLESQVSQLQNQQTRLEEDNMIKARLIGIISHDMISPLKFMGYMSKKLRDSFSSSETGYRTASSFITVTHELESLTVNMLNWIKFHHASLPMKPEHFNVHELASESLEIPATLAQEKGIMFFNDIPPDAQAFQYRQAIGVIIYNLAMNAMKYTGQGEIRVTYESTSEGIFFTVTDTGSGMSSERVAQLNNADNLVSEHAKGETKKYQFGYTIIKDLLRVVQGTLHIESTLNKGTRVTVHCPILNSEAATGD